jgi:hypothetical protein
VIREEILLSELTRRACEILGPQKFSFVMTVRIWNLAALGVGVALF